MADEHPIYPNTDISFKLFISKLYHCHFKFNELQLKLYNHSPCWIGFICFSLAKFLRLASILLRLLHVAYQLYYSHFFPTTGHLHICSRALSSTAKSWWRSANSTWSIWPGVRILVARELLNNVSEKPVSSTSRFWLTATSSLSLLNERPTFSAGQLAF